MSLSPSRVDTRSVPQPPRGPIIASFASARDARLFAGLKHDAGESVTITAGDPNGLAFDVRTLPRTRS